MKPALKILTPPWMDVPETKAVMAALSGRRTDMPLALFVGGCVRNMMLGVPVGDIDIATVFEPDNVIERLGFAGIKTVPTGIEHGTVTAVLGDKTFEITTLRRDVSTDGRRATVSFTKDWLEDAKRRDFTINTLLADTDGAVYDPTELGLPDIAARRVVFVGDPARRIAEDYLRILRFFRFFAMYGEGEPDAAALEACRASAAGLSGLSRERVTHEFMRILGADKAVYVLSLMNKNNILKDIFHSKYKDKKLETLIALQGRFGTPHLLSRLIVLSNRDSAHLRRIESVLALSNAQKREITVLQAALDDLKSGVIKSEKGFVFKYKNYISLQAFLLRAVFEKAPPEAELIRLAGLCMTWTPPVFPVSGHDLSALGLKPGPEMGEILKQTELWWMNRDCEPDRGACLDEARRLIPPAA